MTLIALSVGSQPIQKPIRHIKGRSKPATTSHENGQEFPEGKGPGAESLQPFPGAVAFGPGPNRCGIPVPLTSPAGSFSQSHLLPKKKRATQKEWLAGRGRRMLERASSPRGRDHLPSHAFRPQHFLYFFPLPQGHGSFRPGSSLLVTGACFRSSPRLVRSCRGSGPLERGTATPPAAPLLPADLDTPSSSIPPPEVPLPPPGAPPEPLVAVPGRPLPGTPVGPEYMSR